ncbi:YdcF family protein [Radiobacillus kanasensis]|uniref:YdcF family protein n=1 Tax=Radiobacillus kanasensis TaxID=2844358 RepID=UPI001E451319|nr:YdcF family protein [Radiobacillus kanasensis]UFT98405.1 YdcF family protein [Radiobacillus kanasensis]
MTNPFDCITEFIFVEHEPVFSDVILIPGSDHQEMMIKAADLFHKGFAPYMLPSGGTNPHMNTTEWDFLRKIAVERGVPEACILKEDKAQHTIENAHFSLDVLRKKEIRPSKAIIVCKAGHARRALLSYQAEFPRETEFVVCPVVDKFGITKENWFLSDIGISRVMSEVEKIGQYFSDRISNWVE